MIFLNLFLAVLSIVLLVVLLPFGIIASLVRFFHKKKVSTGIKSLSTQFLTVAIAVDQLGNVVCASLFNYTLRKSGGYLFGNPDETISGVVGKNKRSGHLTGAGRALDWLLEKLDPDHSIKSIEDDENH